MDAAALVVGGRCNRRYMPAYGISRNDTCVSAVAIAGLEADRHE